MILIYNSRVGLYGLDNLNSLNSHAAARALVNLTPSEVCHGILNTDSVRRWVEYIGIFLSIESNILV